MAATRWAGDAGFAEIAAFRKNMMQYLNTKGTDEETFALDILQALCQETVQDGIKIHLATLLQEYAAVLLPTSSSAEQAVGSLLGIFEQTATSAGPSILRGQILVATTSIALQYDFQRHHASLFANLVETLLEVVCHTGSGSSSHLRATACCCLHELETCLPGMLRYKMEYIYQLAQIEMGASQGYLLLLVTTLHHTLCHLRLQQHSSVSPGSITDLLSNRTEPLKPYIIPTDIHDCTLTTKMKDANQLKVVDVREIRRLVAYVMDHAHLLTTAAQVRLLATLACIVDAVPDIAPSIFKWAIMKHSRSYDVCILSLMFVLKDLFGEVLVGVDDQARLYQTVVAGMSHPTLTPTQRMLLTEWLTQNTQMMDEPTWPGLISSSQLYYIFPRVFDGTDTQLKKLSLLSRLLPKFVSEDDLEEVFCGCVSGLQEFVERGMGGRHATALFCALYDFYRNHPHPELLEGVKWILVRLGQNHGRLALRVLNFVEAVQQLHPDSGLGREVLLSLLSTITMESTSSISMTQLQHHLAVLQRIAMETSIQPQVIVNYLQALLMEEDVLQHGDWSTGTQILAVCSSLVQHHNVNTIFVGLGEVLYQLSQRHRDVDIRDRATLYYTLITSLAPHKVSSLLKQRATSSKDTQSLASFVMRNNKFPVCHNINHLQQPLLRLTRLSSSKAVPVKSDEVVSMDSIKAENILTEYKTHVASQEDIQHIGLDFTLHFVDEGGGEHDELFALVLHFLTSPHYHPIQDISVPYLARTLGASAGCRHVRVVLVPRQPVPSSFNVEAVFTAKESSTWMTEVPGVEVGLEDLWRPLPVPKSWPSRLKSDLFSQLWKSLTSEDTETSDGEKLESVFCLSKEPEQVQDLLNTRWKHLQVYDENEEGNMSSAEERLGIFLPPKCHLLLKLRLEAKRAVISMATDHPMIFPLVCDYLRKLEDVNVIK